MSLVGCIPPTGTQSSSGKDPRPLRGEDGFARLTLPNGEEIHWRLRPFSLTQVAGVDLVMRGGRRTVDVTPGRDIAILPFLRCVGPKIPDAHALRAAFHILHQPRVRHQHAYAVSSGWRNQRQGRVSSISARMVSG
jgi:hypothetical protein